MGKARLETFSDGVIAILITIMVLELKVPHGTDWSALRPLFPAFLTYMLSFAFLGIYWNNHHHLFHLVGRVNGRILWANLHLMFWLSLIPFVTGWMGENHVAAIPTAAYGIVLLMAAISWLILQDAIVTLQGKDSPVKKAVGVDTKGKISAASYVLAVPLAFIHPWISVGLFTFVAFLWIVPDRRVESQLARDRRGEGPE